MSANPDLEPASSQKAQHKFVLPVVGYFITTVVSLLVTPIQLPGDLSVLERVITQSLSKLVIYAGVFCIVLLVMFVGQFLMRVKMPLAAMMRPASIVTICLLLLGTLGSWYGRNADSIRRGRETAPTAAAPTPTRPTSAVPTAKIVTAVSTQSSQGVVEADLDQPGLARLEGWIVDTVVEKSKLAPNGATVDPVAFRKSLNPKSVYVTVSGMKFAVTKMRPPGTRMVFIVGIRGEELIRVACLRDSDEDIAVLSGPCGEEIERSFHVTLPPN